MNQLIDAALTVADHARRKLGAPIARAKWRRASAPFWHAGLHGLKFELYPGEVVDYQIFAEGLFEKRFLLLIERLFAKGGVALDVGANIGNHSLFFSRVFDRVIAFEPNPAMVARLERNIAENRARNITVARYGLSDRNAMLSFAAAKDQNAGSGRFVTESSVDATHTLEVRAGDDALEALGVSRVDFIKIDVEGHELSVIKGMQRTIAASRPVIAFEFHPADFAPGYFSKFGEALPKYRFVEASRRIAGGFIINAGAFLRAGGLPLLSPLTEITKGSYENILAIPWERKLAGERSQAA